MARACSNLVFTASAVGSSFSFNRSLRPVNS